MVRASRNSTIIRRSAEASYLISLALNWREISGIKQNLSVLTLLDCKSFYNYTLNLSHLSISTMLIKTLAVSVFIASVSAGCFSGGVGWVDDRDGAAYHAERACRGYDGQAGRFQGTFKPGESRSVCVELSGTVRADFTIANTNLNSALDLKDDDCVTKLHNEIYGCWYGGDSTTDGWRAVYVSAFCI